jgi:hypothetical protein
MNKFQKVGLAIAVASGMAFAQGDPSKLLWTKDAPHGQVNFPWIAECKDGASFTESNSDDPCYKDYGGWWFGYVAGENGEGAITKCDNGTGKKSGINKVEAFLGPEANRSWVSFVGPDYENDPSHDCEGPAVTNKEDPSEDLLGKGLQIKFTTGIGIQDDWEPDIAAIAVNLTKTPGSTPETSKDLTLYRGFCLTYESDHNTSHDLALELGWDEGTKDNQIKGYDTWIAPIPPVPNGQTKNSLNFFWELDGSGKAVSTAISGNAKESGSFMQEGWSEGEARPGPFSIDSTTRTMTAVKIRLKQYAATVVNFTLLEFGFFGGCETGTPILAGGPKSNPVGFELIGKTLSVVSITKPVSVQIINLHGAVVHTQTVSSPSDKINLSGLPTGVYLVRAPAIGYVNKFALK